MESCTQLLDSSIPSLDEGDEGLREIWGLLRRNTGGRREETKLKYRTVRGERDTYSIGRIKTCDIVVDDVRVSKRHCLIFLDYSQPRLRVFLQDSSSNGTFINCSTTRLSFNEKVELKSGDEVFVIDPRHDEIKAGRTYNTDNADFVSPF